MSTDSSKAPDTQEPKKKDLGSIWQVIAATILIFIFSEVYAVVLLQIGFGIFKHPHQPIDQSALTQFIYVLLAEGAAAALAIFLTKQRGLSLKFIGLGRKPKLGDVGRALGAFFLFYLVLIAVAALLSAFFPDLNKGEQDVGFNNLQTAGDSILAFCALVFIPPLGEETLVRGYLYSGLRSRMKYLPALIITSIIFGAAHLQTGAGPGLLWAAGLNTFVLSIVLVYLREKTGALYAGMLLHALNNAVAFGFHFHAHLF